ncbi:MAG: ABC transporter permease [Saprospiraceae bacterium]
MFKYYINIALRNLTKQKVLTGINILGLSIGIACFSLFLLYSLNEFNFDRFNVNSKNIYRVYRWSFGEKGNTGEGDVYMPMPLGPALKKDLPDVKDFVRIRDPWQSDFVKVEDQMFRIPITYADQSFFDVFSFKLLQGQPSTALKDLHNIVLSKKTASKLFGAINPVGKSVRIKAQDEFESFIVTGIVENAPSNSSIDFEIIANFEYLATTRGGARSVNNWNRSSYITYVLLNPESTLHLEPKRLQQEYTKYYPGNEEEMRKRNIWKGEGPPTTYGLQPLEVIHTDTKITGGTIASVDPKNLWILLAISFGILLIACINFTTLAIGRSAGRAREVGIRKVIGGGKSSLIIQFISEAIFLSVLSTGVGLILVKYLLPYFNQLSGRELALSFTQFPELVWLLTGLTIMVGLLAGSYPALVLSGFNPIEVLKQKIKVGGSNLFTKSLVTVQFVLSIGLIASTAIILQQIRFMSSKHPGFNKENVVVVNGDDVNTKKVYPLFRSSILQQPQVKSVASAELGLGEGTGWSRQGFEYKGVHKDVYEYFIDKDYIPLMGIEILRGRNFSPDFTDDTVKSVLVNEKMVSDFGWTLDNAVGQVIKGYFESNEAASPVVIGVVKDFNFRPLREQVKPQLFHQFSDYTSNKYFVRLNPGDPSAVLKSMEAEWKKLVPELPFRYTFLDEDLDRFYKAENRWGKIIGWAGGISIFLACLGLFGLAALAAVNRTKEVGIRKVLGASVGSIVGLLSKDFIRLISIAIVIAIPVAWFFMNKWLQGFAYRINVSWIVMLSAGMMALMIAFVTVSFQGIKAGLTNPVKSLRSE